MAENERVHVDRVAVVKSLIESGKEPGEGARLLPKWLDIIDGKWDS